MESPAAAAAARPAAAAFPQQPDADASGGAYNIPSDDGASAAVASVASSRASPAAVAVRRSPVSLLAAFDRDASLQRQPSVRAALRPAVQSLQHAIRAETIAHALTLYRYVRLQRKLMAAAATRRGGCTRLTAAKTLNRWIAAAYGERWPELLPRIKHDAHRLFDLFGEPAADDDWWPRLLEELAAGTGGGRARHLLEALLALDRHYAAIQCAYTHANRLQLLRYYLLGQQWSARQIEADLLQDGVIREPPSSPLLQLHQTDSQPHRLQEEEEQRAADQLEEKEAAEGSCSRAERSRAQHSHSRAAKELEGSHSKLGLRSCVWTLL
jgi:hypothetical protein